MADNYTVLDGNGDPLTKASTDLGAGVQADKVDVATAFNTVDDAIKTGPIIGKVYDGDGNEYDVKTVRGEATASGDNTAIAAVVGKKICVLRYALQAKNTNSAVVSAYFRDDAGTPVSLSMVWDFDAREGCSAPLANSGAFYFETTSGQALKLNLSAAQTVRYELVYIER